MPHDNEKALLLQGWRGTRRAISYILKVIAVVS